MLQASPANQSSVSAFDAITYEGGVEGFTPAIREKAWVIVSPAVYAIDEDAVDCLLLQNPNATKAGGSADAILLPVRRSDGTVDTVIPNMSTGDLNSQHTLVFLRTSALTRAIRTTSEAASSKLGEMEVAVLSALKEAYMAEPKKLKAGESVKVECTWDNPTDQDVFWGEGTGAEMCLGTMLMGW